MSGVPRMIHTNVFVNQRKGLNPLMEPNETMSPKGAAQTSVIAKIWQVVPKPARSLSVTVDSGIIF
jgi:hypothetical protein